jgi:exosortase/archaeosortase family protein
MGKGGKKNKGKSKAAAEKTDSGAAQGRRTVIRFVGLFAVFMAIFYAITITPFAEDRAWPAYLQLNATVSGAILNGLGQDVTVDDRAIRSPRGSLLIERGCDAIHPSGLFASAVLASPVPLWTRLAGMFVGTFLLATTNLIRIISLYFVQIHWRDLFDMMHVEVWQALFIFLAVLLWVVWAGWAVKRGAQEEAKQAAG